MVKLQAFCDRVMDLFCVLRGEKRESNDIGLG